MHGATIKINIYIYICNYNKTWKGRNNVGEKTLYCNGADLCLAWAVDVNVFSVWYII
jgi:hypothetical protein